jgi:hypothetical protein
MAPERAFGRADPLVQITGELKSVVRVALVIDDACSQFIPNSTLGVS